MRGHSTRIAAILALFAVPSLAQDAANPAKARYDKQLALVVGINYGGLDNKDTIDKLKNAEDDAKSVHRILIDFYGYDAKNITLLTGPDATKANIDKELEKLLDRATAGDSVLFYYSGHGEHQKDEFDETYALLVPFDARVKVAGERKELDRKSCVEFDDLINVHFKRTHARHSLIVLDCCYSGQVFGGEPQRNLVFDHSFDTEAFAAKCIQAMSAGLANKRVADGTGGHSPFTQALLGALETVPKGLKTSEFAFTSEALYHEVRTRLNEEIKAGKSMPLFGNAPIKGNNKPANFHFFPTDEARKQKAPTADIAGAENLRFDLRSLTGLNGQWWFDETPWLVPAIREKLGLDTELARLRIEEGEGGTLAMRGTAKGGSAFLHPDVGRVHELLRQKIREKGLTETPGPSYALARILLERASKVNKTVLEVYVKQLEEALKKKSDIPRSLDRHLLAVLKHKLDDPGALEEYRAAITEYSAVGSDPSMKTLHALCLSDLARFLMTKRKYEDAIKSFEAAELMIERQPTVLYLDCLCNRSEAHRRLGQWDRAKKCLMEAVKLADTHLQQNHPLRAFSHEKAAWGSFERWYLRDAIRDFEQANLAFDDAPELNDQGLITRLRVVHGRAMAERFSGRIPEARKRFRGLETEIDSILKKRREGGSIPESFVQGLRDRQVNTMERRADSYLFYNEPDKAADILEAAAEHEKDLPLDSKESILFRLYAKQAIAHALRKRPGDAEKALRAAGNRRLTVAEFRDMRVIFDLAEAFTAWAKGEGTEELSRLVGKATASEELIENTRRDELEMILLAATTLEGDDAAPPVKLVLDRILRTGDPSVRSFARRYQDAVIESLAGQGGEHHKAVIQWLIATKIGDEDLSPADLAEKPTLIVHAWETKGLAILLQPDADPIISTFPTGVSQWRTIAKPQGVAAPWDKTLAEALAKIQGPVQIYWSDPVCELTDEAYPFDTPPKNSRKFVSARSTQEKPSK